MRKTIEAPSVDAILPIEESIPQADTSLARFFGRESIERVYREIAGGRTASLTYRVSRVERDADSYMRSIRDTANTLRSVRSELETLREELRAELAKPIDTAKLDMLRRFPWVQSVRAKENKIIVRTRLLFANVRIEDGSSEEVRRCIGAFDIVLSPNYDDIEVRVHNILFGSLHYDHWAIRGGQPCWGSYSAELNIARRARDVYGILDIVFHFLMSTDDGSAWTRSHHWVSSRMTINAKGETFREGDMVTVVNPNNEHDYIEIDDMGYVPLGTGGRVLSVSGNVALVHFDEFHMYDSYAEFMADNEEDVDMSDHEDESGEYRIFWVSTRKITKGADSTAREYTNESMHRLDTLPTFASVEEGMRALRAQKVDTITTSNENV